MSNAFLQLAFQGKNQWWRYLLGSVLAICIFLTGSILIFSLLGLYIESDGNPNTGLLPQAELETGELPIFGVSPLVLYIVNNLAFPCLLLGLFLALRYFHRRSFKSLITPAGRISWKRIWQGFSVFFVLKMLEIFVSYQIAPEDFTLNFQAGAFLAFLPAIVVFTPLQTATEEFLFRGYLLQGIGSKLGQWMGAILSSALFAAVHLSNPEVTTQDSWDRTASIVAFYFVVGVFLAWFTLKDRTLELALGVHAANNMATLLLVTSPNSALPSPAIFSIAEIEADFTSVFFSLLWFLAFSWIVFRLLKRPLLAS